MTPNRTASAPEAERGRLLAELGRYVPGDDRERSLTRELCSFIERNPGAFERTLAVGHVTGSAWVIDRSGTCALLTHHRKLGKWLQPGGHADGDADVARVALREAREESGLRAIVAATAGIYDVDIHPIPARGEEAAHLHYDVRFAFFADSREAPRASAESHAVAWVPLAHIERLAIDDSVRRLVAKTPALVRATRC